MATITLTSCVVAGMALAANAMPAIRIPADGWTVNNFRQKDCGAEFKCLAAPDGANAIRVKYFGDKPSTLSMAPSAVKAQRDAWPETFAGLKGYFWNNGQTNVANISLRTDDGQWNARITLEHTGWKVVEIRDVINYQAKFAPLNPRKISSLMLYSPREHAEVGMGTLYWETAGIVLQKLDIGHAAPIVRAAEAPVIDGRLDDHAWQLVGPMPLEHFAHNLPGKSEAGNWVKVAYDDKNVYIAAFLPFARGTKLKATLKEDNVELWDEEDFEFFLYPDSDPRQYFQFLVNPLGTRANLAMVFDQVEDRIISKFKNWNPEWRVKAAVHDDAWTVEAAVPWQTIGADGIPPLVQFQAMRGDRTGASPLCPVLSPVLRRPTEGFGMLAPVAAAERAVNITGLTLKRLADKQVNLSCFLEAPRTIGAVKLEAWYSAPGVAPARAFREFEFDAAAGMINWTFDGGTPVSGLHHVSLKVVPATTGLIASCATYYFNQTLPSRFKFADVVFNPEPKRTVWGAGAFRLKKDDAIHVPSNATPRTVKTAAYLAQRMYDLYGWKPEIKTGGVGAIVLNVEARTVQAKAGVDSLEAYLLDITPTGIAITGAGEAGLYYGVITLMQAASASKQPGLPIKAVAIIDYPTYGKRIANTTEMYHNKKEIGDGNGGYDLEKLKHWIERYVAGSKYNLLCLSWGDQVNYPSLPEIHHPRNFSPRKSPACTNSRGSIFWMLFPASCFGAHSPAFTHHFPELIETKYGTQQMDVTNPKVYELMAKVFNDLIDMAGGKPTYFQTFNDEWWHKTRTLDDVVYKGKTRQELFYTFLMVEHELLKKRNVRMVMFNDMLNPKHNGGPPFNLSQVAEKLPRDILLATWGEPNDYFAALGFKELWSIYNGFVAHSRKPWQGDTGFGRIQYGSAGLFDQTDQQRTLYYAFHTEFQAANYAWNKDEKGALPMAEWTLQYMPSLMGVYSMAPNPAAGRTLTPVPLTGGTNTLREVALKSSAVIGDIPMKLSSVTVATNATLAIRFDPGKRISSLYILNNIAPQGEDAVRTLQALYRTVPASRPYGIIVGMYRLTYDDGTTAELPLRLGRNIALLEHTPVESRFVRDCRAVYALNEDQSLALNQFEWINPHPEKDVCLLEIGSRYEFAPVLAAAVTLRDVKVPE